MPEVWRWEAQTYQLGVWPLQLDVRSPEREAASPAGSPSLEALAAHVWIPLAGPCSASCGQGEAPGAPEGQLTREKRLRWRAQGHDVISKETGASRVQRPGDRAR